ncbi:MAG: SIS domain-containing protein, partial [Patescibacteria group bacterium]
KSNFLTSYIFDPVNNPSGQPRMSLGYSLGALLTLFAKCGLTQFGKDEVGSLTKVMNKTLLQFDIENPLEKNIAKLLSQKLKNKIPVLVSSEHLWGVTHAFKNQLNENAKTFTCVFDIPELNHHLLEGLKFPPEAKEVLYFVFLKSKLYSPRVIKRFGITQEVIEKNDYPHSSYELTSGTKLEQVFESLIFGSFVNYYLAMLYGIDPTPIPWVDYFKEKMGR